MFVAQIATEIVGFVSVSLNRATGIGDSASTRSIRRTRDRASARAFTHFALSLMRVENMRLATVSTGGDASHGPARRAYAKLGFGAGIPSVTLYKLL